MPSEVIVYIESSPDQDAEYDYLASKYDCQLFVPENLAKSNRMGVSCPTPVGLLQFLTELGYLEGLELYQVQLIVKEMKLYAESNVLKEIQS